MKGSGVAALAVLALFACGESPASPDPDPREPGLPSFDLSFDGEGVPPDIDGDDSEDVILADAQEVSGNIFGSASDNTLGISLRGRYTLTITDVAQIDPVVGTECPDGQLAVLRDTGALGTPLTGQLLLDINQNQESLRIALNAVSIGGKEWDIVVFRTVNQPLFQTERTETSFSVRQRNAKIVFPVADPEDPEDETLGCRVNLHMVVVRTQS